MSVNRLGYSGKGFLNVSGDSWQAQRHAGQTFTTPETLSHIGASFIPRSLPVFHRALDKASATGEVIDFGNVARAFTLSLFGAVAFGVSAPSTTMQSTHSRKRVQAQEDRFLADFSRPFDNAMKVINLRFATPAYSLFERVLPYGRSLSADLDEIRKFTRRLVQEALGRIREEEEGAKDPRTDTELIIRGLLTSGREMDEDEMADCCLNYVLAGG